MHEDIPNLHEDFPNPEMLYNWIWHAIDPELSADDVDDIHDEIARLATEDLGMRFLDLLLAWLRERQVD